MLRTSLHACALLLVLGALIAGCDGDSATNPQSGDRATADDVALQVGAGAGTISGGAMYELESAAARTPNGLASAKDAAPPGVASDTTFTLGGLTFTLGRTYYDLAGNPLGGYGPTAVRLVVDTRVTGSVTTPRYQGTVGRTSTLEMRGIHVLADTLQFDGAARDTTQSQFQSLDGLRTRHFHATWVRTIEAVRMLKDRNANRYPLSGQVRWTFAADRLRSNNRADVERHFEGTAVLTFDGTATPELVIDDTFRYRIHLLTGSVSGQ